MRFKQKLRLMISERGTRASVVARAAGMKPSAFGNYLDRGSMPSVPTLIKIARALDVPLEWLADDTQDFPPPAVNAPATPAHALIEEAIRTLPPALLLTVAASACAALAKHRRRDASEPAESDAGPADSSFEYYYEEYQRRHARAEPNGAEQRNCRSDPA